MQCPLLINHDKLWLNEFLNTKARLRFNFILSAKLAFSLSFHVNS